MPASASRSTASYGTSLDAVPSEVKRLSKSLVRQRRFVLFVGAGLNGSTVPKWDKLLSALLEHGLRRSLTPLPDSDTLAALLAEIEKEHDLYARATIAELLLGEKGFASILRGELYRDCDFGRLRADCENLAIQEQHHSRVEAPPKDDTAKYGFLCSVARLCLLPNVIAVVTLNFDTLLEFAIESLSNNNPDGRKPVPFGIAREHAEWAEAEARDFLPIYHVHGCLHPPRNSRGMQDRRVTFTQHDYAQITSRPHSWQNASVLHFLRNYPCLFLGLSMVDWNILRLLEEARASGASLVHPTMYCIGASPKGGKGEGVHRALKQRLLASFGVQSVFVPHGRFDQIRDFTDELFFELRKPTAAAANPNRETTP